MCDKMGVDRNGAQALRAMKDYERFEEQLKAYSEFTQHKTLSIGQSILCHGTLVQLCNEAENIPCKVEIELEGVKKELAFANYGAGKPGRRVCPVPPTLCPAKCTKRPFKAEHQAAIAAFYDEVLTTSPNTKDVCRRRIARWLYEQRPMAIMHDSYKGLYSKFPVKHPELQAFVSKTTFKKHAPFYLCKVKREGCLCKSRISRCTTACVAKARTTTISARTTTISASGWTIPSPSSTADIRQTRRQCEEQGR
jgi:hypothetical protein